MGKTTFKLDNPSDGISMETAYRSQTKGRPQKSQRRQHRKENPRLELQDEQLSPQAESPLLKLENEPQFEKGCNSKDEKASRQARLSLRWSKRAEDDKDQEVDTNEKEPKSVSTARRSTIMSWRSRNSADLVTEDATPSSCPLSCQPSTCFIGSLNGTISDMHLPLLTEQTKARLTALKDAPKQCQLEVMIESSDELPFGAYSHPQVRVHIVDRCTGRAICAAQMTNKAKFLWAASDHHTSYTNAFEWQQALGISVDLPRFLSARTVMLFEILETKAERKGTRFRRGKRFESVSTHDDDDEEHKLHISAPTAAYRRIAWGFFHTITSKGSPTMNCFVLPHVPNVNEDKQQVITDVCKLRVRLFEYQVLTWMDKYQAKSQWGWRNNHPTIPAVFLQYQKRSRLPAPSTLHVQLRAVSSATGLSSTTEMATASAMAHGDQVEAGLESGCEDNQQRPETVCPVPIAEDEGKLATSPADYVDAIGICKRNAFEPCLIPQRVLCSLPTGKKGCSAVSFSPCGHYLAASVSPELGDFVVRVYQMGSRELIAVGRGHKGVIYSLEWSVDANGLYRLLSASSDGTVRLWELPSPNSTSSSTASEVSIRHHSHLLPLVFLWQQFPSFVYCAMFLPGSNGEIVLTGSSDGCMRFRKESSVPNGQPEYGVIEVSSAAVQTICVEAKSGRIFCGDAKGDILVWRRSPSSSALSSYERVKVIETGQTSITSLRLHPRKGHLLVHTQPNAIFQYELRSYLLLNKSYAGVACESLLVKSAFSPDGKFVISGSEDGIPLLFTSLYGQQLQRGVWGTRFFHDYPVLDVSWSPTAHMVALCSYGGDNPIVILCSYRDDQDAAYTDASVTNASSSTTSNLQQFASGYFRGTNQQEAMGGDHIQRLQRALERRQNRLYTKISQEAEANVNLASSIAM